MYTDNKFNAYDAGFQQAFRTYFQEIGISLREDTDVFDEIQKSQDQEGMQGILLREENGGVKGFILFQTECFESSSGFFSEKVGFIRELWIDKAARRQNHGTRLLQAAYEELHRSDVRKILLTYDEAAIGFYQKLGYEFDDSYQAKNAMRCIVKYLEDADF